MEEPRTPTNAPAGRFMDISGPGGSPEPKAAPVEHEPVQAAPPAPAEVPVEAAPAEEPVAEPPVAETPAEPAAEAPQPSEPEEPTSSAAEEEPVAAPDEQSNHPQLPPKTAHKAPIVVVFVAMAVCLVLTGLVVFTYFKSKNDTKTGSTSSSNSKTTVEKPQASPDDIDQTSNEIDENLSSINDDVDFAASALSDQALGL